MHFKTLNASSLPQVYYFPEGPAESKGTASDNMYTTVIRVNGEPWDNAPPTPEKLKPDR